MTTALPATMLQLRSLLKRDGTLELSLAEFPLPRPVDTQVLIRVEAAPINPSDQYLMFAGAEAASPRGGGTRERPTATLTIPATRLPALAGRFDQSLPAGNEGAGVVVAAGPAPAAQALLGRTVAAWGGGFYAQYRCLDASQCLALPDGTPPAAGAACFVNPLTALGMVETMRLEGHRALVHTAAASNLGQMLQRICRADGIPLVNVVRSPAQVALLRGLGATHVVDSSAPTFEADLATAVAATGATIGFDAVGGGTLAGTLLGAMEAALLRNATEYNRYGSPVHKQVYVYGVLDPGPIVLHRTFGFAWSLGGWLLMPFLQRIGAAGKARLQARVVAELATTFASRYTREVSLAEALDPAAIAVYAQRATGAKFLVAPNR